MKLFVPISHQNCIKWLENDDEFLADSAALRGRYEAGIKKALLNQLNRSLTLNRPVPDWARDAFLAAYKKKLNSEIKSWDEVFGQPAKKHVRRKRGNKLDGDLIYNMVVARHSAGESIGKEMFAAIGKEVGASGGKVERLYGSFRSWISGEWEETPANPEDLEVQTVTIEKVIRYPDIVPHRGKKVVRKKLKNK